MKSGNIKPIALSFKNNVEEKELYEWIIAHSNFSGFIKDVLKREKCRVIQINNENL